MTRLPIPAARAHLLSVVARVVAAYAGERFYDPSQPRDDRGRWSGGGGSLSVLESGMDDSLDRVYNAWENKFGYGPCGAYAALRREQGWGDVALTIARTQDGVEFPHYVIVQNGAIIDMANPLGETLEYTQLEVLDADEMPEIVTSS